MSLRGAAERPWAAGRLRAQAWAAHGRARDRRTRVPSAGELAWLALLPTALLTAAAIVVLGPPLGRIVLSRGEVHFFPLIYAVQPPRPEPREEGRFLIALLAPLLLTAGVALGLRFASSMRAVTIHRLVVGVQLLAAAFVAVCLVLQRRSVPSPPNRHAVYFTGATLLVAAAIAALICAGLASTEARRRFAALAAETRGRRIATSAAAAAAIAVWLLPAINFEHTIGNANRVILFHIPYWLDEAFAVLDHRHPLVDFAAQYGSLWPYAIAAAMAAAGASIGSFTIATATIGAVAMVAMFATFRRVARSSVAALLLFLPFLATAFFTMEGPLVRRYAMDNLFGTFPLRYAGPLLLAWLVARHLDGAGPRRARWLFLAAGLAVLNNIEFGLPALGATAAALLWSSHPASRRRLRQLAFEAAAGLAGAFGLVSALTLSTAGSLPHLGLLVSFSRVFAVGGWGMLPMVPVLGVSTIVYLTYVAAIGAASVRAVNREPDRLMTGLLAWSGVFGLGIGSYYIGRSHAEVLTNMFVAWALTITLLFVLVVRGAAARAPHRPTIAEAACLLAFGVLACSLPQVPRPWSELARLERTTAPVYAHVAGERFVAAHTTPGEKVLVLAQLGHRAAYNQGVVDVTTSSWGGELVTQERLDESLDRLRAESGRKVFVAVGQTWPEIVGTLLERHYVPSGREAALAEFVRAR